MTMNIKQKTKKIEPRIKLNYNIFTTGYLELLLHISKTLLSPLRVRYSGGVDRMFEQSAFCIQS